MIGFPTRDNALVHSSSKTCNFLTKTRQMCSLTHTHTEVRARNIGILQLYSVP